MYIKTKYGMWRAQIHWRYYENSRRAMELITKDGEVICVATINIPEVDVPDGHVLIKNWSENEGVLESLLENGVIEDTGIRIPTGYVEAALCKVLALT